MFAPEMAGYQLPIKRDQRHTVDRVSGSWTVQDRGVPETDSARCLPNGSAEEMAAFVVSRCNYKAEVALQCPVKEPVATGNSIRIGKCGSSEHS
jgi:hypothetical protein